jgi:uncharacterized protein with ParB-like and HNH nuclease domain
MPEQQIELKPLSISEITDKKFYIRHYQRGYRWTEQQVEQLLNDIDAFIPKELPGNSDKKTFYCLQPVVVKRIEPDSELGQKLPGEWHEVIDGQQRLTTIYLILHYIKNFWGGRQKNNLFEIDYETREQCVEFLQKIKVNDDDTTVDINKDNIDFYHISTAYQTIRNWELNYRERHNKDFNDGEFKSNFSSYSKVIWYEVNQDEDSVPLFERLNLGKIPLTNAELTKALFLADASFNELGSEEQQIKHFEIALLWDEIEHKLNEKDQKFWSFITNKKRIDYDTKIELILDLIADKSDDEEDPLYTFLKFSQKNREQTLSDLWTEIEQFYYTLVEWNNDRELYHLIGYLISSRTVGGFKKEKLSNLVTFSMTHEKSEFKKLITNQIKSSVAFEISDLRYGDDSNKLFNVLLLFNVETYRRSKSIAEFYPFKQHKGNQWSLEHIHARKSDGLQENKKEQWTQWLDHHTPLLKELSSHEAFSDRSDEIKEALDLIEKFNTDKLTWQRFLDIFNQVNDILTDNAESMDLESDGISNLALLSQPDNAALNCSAFEIKRREIIRLDKQGSFIPICTRRVFLKYYQDSESSVQSFFWSTDDRAEYAKELNTMLQDYLPAPRKETDNEDQ